MTGPLDAKRELRRRMREVRRVASADPARSAAISRRVAELVAEAGAQTVMVFDAVPGEPDLGDLVDDWRSTGIAVVTPDPDPAASWPIDPETVDVVVVPGLAFTSAGDRLGQGGGWYDRFLAATGPACVRVGVCFDEQIVESIPIEAHDVPVDAVVTPTGGGSTA